MNIVEIIVWVVTVLVSYAGFNIIIKHDPEIKEQSTYPLAYMVLLFPPFNIVFVLILLVICRDTIIKE